MQTFKEYLEEGKKEIHPDLANHGIDHEAVRKYQALQKARPHPSDIPTRGEKVKLTRARNEFFKHLEKIHNGDEAKVRKAHNALANRIDMHGEAGAYK